MLGDTLISAKFFSEDSELNRLLEAARRKLSSPDFRTRYDALKDLWDAFERLKTLEPPRKDKRLSSANLIARVSQEPKIVEMLDTEMRVELESFGNGFFIRHANAGQVSLETSEERLTTFSIGSLPSSDCYCVKPVGRSSQRRIAS